MGNTKTSISAQIAPTSLSSANISKDAEEERIQELGFIRSVMRKLKWNIEHLTAKIDHWISLSMEHIHKEKETETFTEKCLTSVWNTSKARMRYIKINNEIIDFIEGIKNDEMKFVILKSVKKYPLLDEAMSYQTDKEYVLAKQKDLREKEVFVDEDETSVVKKKRSLIEVSESEKKEYHLSDDELQQLEDIISRKKKK